MIDLPILSNLIINATMMAVKQRPHYNKIHFYRRFSVLAYSVVINLTVLFKK